jgi:hypothetical protein
MRLIAGACLAVALALPAGSSAAVVDDVVVVATKYGGGPLTVRTLAIVSLSMFDAANAVERRYEPYMQHASPPAGTDAEQAALGAGCAALVALRPQQEEAIRKECYAIDGNGLSDNAVASRRYGAPIGIAHAEARSNDGIGVANAYRPATAPGVYVPTTLPIGFDAATAKPFAMKSPSQFRPAPPPALTSERWVRDYNETRTMGARDRSQRTVEQTATALFFASLGPQQFLDSMAAIPVAAQGSAVDRARYYALVHMTLFDTGIAIFDAKYAYNFWRPITAIRNGGTGNNATPRDPTWVPLVDTPMHPEYPCAHCIGSAAFAGVVLSLLGDGKPFAVRSATVPGQAPSTREYRKTSELSADASDARVWSGVHYRTSTEVGSAMGVAIGEYVLGTQLRPVRR